MDKFEQVWTRLKKFKQSEKVWTELNMFGKLLTRLENFGQVWTSLNRLEQVWKSLNKFEHVWLSKTSLKKFEQDLTCMIDQKNCAIHTHNWQGGKHCLTTTTEQQE